MRLLNSNTNLENSPKKYRFKFSHKGNIQSTKQMYLYAMISKEEIKSSSFVFSCNARIMSFRSYPPLILLPLHHSSATQVCSLSILRTLEIYCNHLGWMILLDVAISNIICLSYDITAMLDVLTIGHCSKNI